MVRLSGILTRGRCLMLLFSAPGINLGLVKAEFTGGSGNADACDQLKSFFTNFRRMLLTGLLAG